MSAVELIVTALAAGAGVGVRDTASAAVGDAYAGLKEALRRRFADRRSARQALEADETEADVWQARIEQDLIECGAVDDEEIVSAARRLLELADPAGIAAGKYSGLGLSGAEQPQVGDNSVRIANSYGATAGTMTGPVTISYGQWSPVPPAPPEA